MQPCIADLCTIIIIIVGCADNFTLIAVGPSPGWGCCSCCVRVAVAETVNSDLGKISERCDLWGMKLNASVI